MTTRISRIYFGDFQQFRDLELDFRGPDGRASNRICFIGRNGTGKSTLLDQLSQAVTPAPNTRLFNGSEIEVQTGGTSSTISPSLAEAGIEVGLRAVWPAEESTNKAISMQFTPETTLAWALDYVAQSEARPVRHATVGAGNPAQLWNHLLFHAHNRIRARDAFERRPENLERTKRELIEEFDQSHPEVLKELGQLWNRLLRPAGIEVDPNSIRVPTGMKDNLELRLRLRDSGEHLPYGRLSTGIRNFLFQVGHLWLLYFDRDVQNGFVFIDEPENSLFPDFLFELMTLLDEILGENTQLFVATHSPLVAAQFEPWQRILLDWNDDGTVSARKGTAPKGDDPNDVLTQDFELTEVMGPAGRAAYRKYLTLRKQLRRAKEPEKTALLEEAAEIGRAYGFE